MVHLLLAILFSGIPFFVLKSFSKFNINTLQAIVYNYIVAFTVGTIVNKTKISISAILEKSWLLYCLYLGLLFIVIFLVMGKTAQKNGVSVASVASKMSLIIPVLFGVYFFKEEISLLKACGIFIALIAVYFTTKKNNATIEPSNFIYPILLFIGSGIIDTSLNFIQEKYLQEEETALFSSLTFLSAFILGILILIYQIIKKQFTFHFKNLIGGILLGIPNYFSMYFIIRALQNEKIQSATLFTLINIGIILFTTTFGIILFKEKLKRHNYIGIVLAIITLLLVSI